LIIYSSQILQKTRYRVLEIRVNFLMKNIIKLSMKYLPNKSNCCNLIFLIEASSLLGFRILNEFDTYCEYTRDRFADI